MVVVVVVVEVVFSICPLIRSSCHRNAIESENELRTVKNHPRKDNLFSHGITICISRVSKKVRVQTAALAGNIQCLLKDRVEETSVFSPAHHGLKHNEKI